MINFNINHKYPNFQSYPSVWSVRNNEIYRQEKEVSEKPYSYQVIKPGFLSKGSMLSPKKYFDFVANEGYKSIISLTYEKDPLLIREMNNIELYNNSNPQASIKFEIFDIATDTEFLQTVPLLAQELSPSGEKIHYKKSPLVLAIQREKMQNFIDIINSLPKPIYMHCYAGEHISGTMVKLFNAALKAGKIKTEN